MHSFIAKIRKANQIGRQTSMNYGAKGRWDRPTKPTELAKVNRNLLISPALIFMRCWRSQRNPRWRIAGSLHAMLELLESDWISIHHCKHSYPILSHGSAADCSRVSPAPPICCTKRLLNIIRNENKAAASRVETIAKWKYQARRGSGKNMIQMLFASHCNFIFLCSLSIAPQGETH